MKMKKKSILIVAIILVLAVVGVFVFRTFFGASKAIDNEPEANVTGKSNVLVAYFSWSGNVQKMARWVADETGGDIFRIVPETSYGEDYGKCADRAKEELDNETRPQLAASIEKEIMEGYDTIFIGFPVWWYDLPMSVWTFLEEYELKGKTIIPFFSHNGSSNGASSLETLTRLCPESNVLTEEALSIRGSRVAGSEDDVRKWVKEAAKTNP